MPQPQLQPPPQAAQAPVATPVKADNFTPQTAAPVTLTPGASGERKMPAGAAAPQPQPQLQPPPQAAAQAPAQPQQPVAVKPNQLQWIDQLAPKGAGTTYTNGAENCGPTVGAMIARSIGWGTPGASDAQLVMDLATAAGTTDQGTSGNGMLNMFETMGMQTNAALGADLSWINTQLTGGRYVTALGNYYQVPGRIDSSLMAGHYLDITGYHEATHNKLARYSIADPASQKVKSMTSAELTNYITTGPNGGFALSAWCDPAAVL